MLVNSFCIYVTNLANPINRLTIVYDERHPPFLLQRLSERMAVQWRRSRNCGFQGTHWVIYSLVGSPGRDGSQPQGTTPTSTYLTQSGTPQICAPESDYFTGAYFRSSKAVTLDSPPPPLSNEGKEVSRAPATSCFRNAKVQRLEGSAFEGSLSWFPLNLQRDIELFQKPCKKTEFRGPGPWGGFFPDGVMQIWLNRRVDWVFILSKERQRKENNNTLQIWAINTTVIGLGGKDLGTSGSLNGLRGLWLVCQGFSHMRAVEAGTEWL